MGVLRLLLALSVVAGHSQTFFRPFFFINAKAAVLCFFIISGFYTTMILREKYKSRGAFLLSRWLKLYPPYAAVALIYGVILYSTGRFELDWPKFWFNVSFVGQDWGRMIGAYPMNAAKDSLGTDTILVPQAWSLSVEMQLYIIGALLLPLRNGLWWLCGAALVGKATMWASGYLEPPYGFMAVGNVLTLFALGCIGARVYEHLTKVPYSIKLSISAVLVSVLIWALYVNGGYVSPNPELPMLPFPESDLFLPKMLFLYGLVAVLTPFLFSVTQKIGADRLLGELSYPVYLCHIAVIDLFMHSSAGITTKLIFIPAVVMGISIFMYLTIVRPINSIRHHFLVGRLKISDLWAVLGGRERYAIKRTVKRVDPQSADDSPRVTSGA